MNEHVSRRGFLKTSAVSAAALGGLAGTVHAADRPIPADILPAASQRKYQLGMVTYNIAADWDIPTIISRCTEVGLASVELRSTHKHGVEPTIGKADRDRVKKQFADCPVRLWALGSACEFHSPDPAVVAKNIAEAKAFVQLAADVGAKTVKVRPNGLPKEVSEEKTLEQIGRSLRSVGEAAAAVNVVVPDLLGALHVESLDQIAVLRQCSNRAPWITHRSRRGLWRRECWKPYRASVDRTLACLAALGPAAAPRQARPQ